MPEGLGGADAIDSKGLGVSLDKLLLTQDGIGSMRKALEDHRTTWRVIWPFFPAPFNSLLVVRDWQGRFHIGVPGNSKFEKADKALKDTLKLARDALNESIQVLAYVPELFFYSDELFDASTLWSGIDRVEWDEVSPLTVFWIERQGKEKIWSNPTGPSGSSPFACCVFWS